VNGVLVKAGDADDMAQALLGYLHSPARIAEHGRQARMVAEQRFSIPTMAEAYSTVYELTLEGK
jgi:glycosyltransferase involved in cell wall biosynthesis